MLADGGKPRRLNSAVLKQHIDGARDDGEQNMTEDELRKTHDELRHRLVRLERKIAKDVGIIPG